MAVLHWFHILDSSSWPYPAIQRTQKTVWILWVRIPAEVARLYAKESELMRALEGGYNYAGGLNVVANRHTVCTSTAITNPLVITADNRQFYFLFSPQNLRYKKPTPKSQRPCSLHTQLTFHFFIHRVSSNWNLGLWEDVKINTLYAFRLLLEAHD